MRRAVLAAAASRGTDFLAARVPSWPGRHRSRTRSVRGERPRRPRGGSTYRVLTSAASPWHPAMPEPQHTANCCTYDRVSAFPETNGAASQHDATRE